MQPILVVHSEEASLRFAEVVLSRGGYRVLAAAGGDRALEVSKQGAEPLILLVMDPVIEQTHGERLRRLYPRVPLLVLDQLSSGDLLDRVRNAISCSPMENA